MSWDRLIGQQPAKDYLHAVLNGRRLGHALLFQGPSGVGKRTAAYILAQVVMCHNPPAPTEACGECRSCQWFASREGALIAHPDMVSLIKTTGGGEKKTEKLVGDQEQILRLETIQYVCEQLHRSPMAGGKRVVIIPEAQRMCRGQAEAANAFLKTLEEPPAAALIILTSSQPEALLETIVSRVQSVNFRRLSTAEVLSGLAGAQSPQAEKEMVATLADGRLGRALDLLKGDLKTWRRAVIAALEGFNERSCPAFGLALWALAEAEGKRLFEAEKDKEDAADDAADDDSADGPTEEEVKTESGWKRFVFGRLLELCEACFRDALVAAAGGPDASRLMLQPDQVKLAQTLATRFGEEGCTQALEQLRDAAFAVKLYVKGDVISRALSGKLVDALIQKTTIGATGS